MMHLSVAASGLSRQAVHQFVSSSASRVVSEHGVVLDAAWLGSGPILAIKEVDVEATTFRWNMLVLRWPDLAIPGTER